MAPSEKGTLVYPSLQGSTNWSSPSYSPATQMFYVPVREMGSIYYKTGVEYKPGTYYTGGSEKRLDEESWGAVRALDVKTGKQVWDFKLPSPPWDVAFQIERNEYKGKLYLQLQIKAVRATEPAAK